MVIPLAVPELVIQTVPSGLTVQKYGLSAPVLPMMKFHWTP
jgi:hypothetical protein